MSFEKEVIKYFEQNNIVHKSNVKFSFPKSKVIHEIDVLLPYYLIEVKENYHESNLLQLKKLDDILPKDYNLVLICRNAKSYIEYFKNIKFKNNFILLSSPDKLEIKKINKYYTHHNYLLNDIERGIRDFGRIYISKKNYDIFGVLTCNVLNINISEKYPDECCEIHLNKINNNLLKYILDGEGERRLFFEFYVKRNYISTPKYKKPLYHLEGLTKICCHGIYFNCKKCL